MIILPIKSKMAAATRSIAFSVFCIELSLYLPSFKVRGLQMTMNFAYLVLKKISVVDIPT